MATSYPTALDTTARFPSDITDDSDSKAGTPRTGLVGFLAQLLRDFGSAIIAIQTALGITPQGTFTDVATRLSARSTVRLAADLAALTTTTLGNLTGLAFPVAASQDYYFRFVIPYQAAGTASGVRFAVTAPGAPTLLSYKVEILGQAADGTDASFVGAGTASGDAVISTADVAVSTNYVAIIEGILSNGTTAGTLQVQAARGGGATGANITIKKGAYGEMYVN